MEKPKLNNDDGPAKDKFDSRHFNQFRKPIEDKEIDTSEILKKAQEFQRQDDETTEKIDRKIRKISSRFLVPNLPKFTETSPDVAKLDLGKIEDLLKDSLDIPDEDVLVRHFKNLTEIDFGHLEKDSKPSDHSEYILNQETLSVNLNGLVPVSVNLDQSVGLTLSQILSDAIKTNTPEYYCPGLDFLTTCKSVLLRQLGEELHILPGSLIRRAGQPWIAAGFKYDAAQNNLYFSFFFLDQPLDEKMAKELKLLKFKKGD